MAGKKGALQAKNPDIKKQQNADQKAATNNTHTILIIAAVIIVALSIGFFLSLNKNTTNYNAPVSFTISDSPSQTSVVSSLNLEITAISLHNKNTGIWYGIPISTEGRYNLVALKNIFAIIGNATIPAGTYNEIIINVSSVVANIDGTNQSLLIPTNSIKILGNFIISNKVGKGSTNWLNIDVNIGQSLHKTRNGRFTVLPVVKTTLRQNSTLSVGPNDTASVTVWGTTPVIYNSGMDLGGLMQSNFLVPQNQNITVSDNGTLEQGNGTSNQTVAPFSFANQSVESCPGGYVLGSDGYCYPECGSGTYCSTSDACYNNQCAQQSSCPEGYYLAADGYCYPTSQNVSNSCPVGYHLEADGNCYADISNVSSSCPPGYYLETDGYCYPENTTTIQECSSGYYLATDGYCYPENTTTVEGCPTGYYLATDGYCYPENTTTVQSCPDGYYLASDGNCYPLSTTTIQSCPDGYYLATDGNCYPISTTSVQPTCPDGYYLATDGYCYPISTTVYQSCPDGYYLATDGYCYPYS